MECEPAQVRLWGPSTFSSWAWQVHKDSNTMAIPLFPAPKNSDRSRHLNIAGGSTHHPPPREPEVSCSGLMPSCLSARGRHPPPRTPALEELHAFSRLTVL